MSDGNYNQGQGQGNAPTRDRHAIGDFRLHLQAEPQQGGTKAPRLSVYYHKNKISIEVRTNVPTDMDGKERGIIRAELDPHVFMMFINLVEKAANGPSGERPERLRFKRPDFRKVNNGEPVLDSQLAFGKTPEGVVFISVLSWSKERPAIQFPFLPDKFIELVRGDGSPWAPADISVELAKGYVRLWSELIPQYMITRFKAEEFKRDGQQQGGQGGGGYNRGGQGGGGGGGGYNNNRGGGGGGGQDMRTESKPASTDSGSWDDLPF